MTNDKATNDAIRALAWRIRRAEPGADPEYIANEFMYALRAQGWRPPSPAAHQHDGPRGPVSQNPAEQARIARETLARAQTQHGHPVAPNTEDDAVWDVREDTARRGHLRAIHNVDLPQEPQAPTDSPE